MRIIRDWEAIRSGADLTINGHDVDGRPIKLTNVQRIKSDKPHPVAVAKGGELYQLA